MKDVNQPNVNEGHGQCPQPGSVDTTQVNPDWPWQIPEVPTSPR